jgi:hypothetical protein
MGAITLKLKVTNKLKKSQIHYLLQHLNRVVGHTCMMKNIYLISSLFFAFCSCHTPRYIYTPSPANINYFKQKGDAKLNAAYSFGDKDGPFAYNKGLDIQAGYALTNHFAIMASYYHRNEKDNYDNQYNWNPTPVKDTSSVDYKRHFFELGAGYFLPLNKNKTVTYNIYGGIALGSFNMNEYDNYNNSISHYYYKNNVSKYFLQSSFNFMLSPYVNFSFTDRLMSIHYGITDTLNAGYYFKDLNKMNLTAFEHTINFQFGIPPIKWMKIDASLTNCYSGGIGDLKTRMVNGSIGLSFDLSKIKKSKK